MKMNLSVCSNTIYLLIQKPKLSTHVTDKLIYCTFYIEALCVRTCACVRVCSINCVFRLIIFVLRLCTLPYTLLINTCTYSEWGAVRGRQTAYKQNNFFGFR